MGCVMGGCWLQLNAGESWLCEMFRFLAAKRSCGAYFFS